MVGVRARARARARARVRARRDKITPTRLVGPGVGVCLRVAEGVGDDVMVHELRPLDEPGLG